MTMRTAAAAAAFLLAAAGAALAQQAAEAPAAEQAEAPSTVPGQVKDVVVARARPMDMSLDEYVAEFVADIIRPVSGNFGIARWDKITTVCVGVQNLEAENAQLIVDRISQIALQVGLKIGEPGCRPNLMILFTTDGPELAQYLVDESPRIFRPFGGEGGTNAGLQALDEFATSDAPVRWWQVTVPMDEAGNIGIDIPNAQAGEYSTARGSNSRIANSQKDVVVTTLVIVDGSKIQGVYSVELADYLAMVSLAQIDPHADTDAYETILNLFDSPKASFGITEWDLTYLRALYQFDQHRMPRQQASLLAAEMVREQRKLFEDE